MRGIAKHEARSVEHSVAGRRPLGVLRAERGEDERIALPMTDRISGIGRPPVFWSRVRTSIRVDLKDVRAVLRQDPRLLGSHHELVHVRQVHQPREAGRRPADVDRVRELAPIPELHVPLIDRLPFGVVGRARSHAGRERAARPRGRRPVEYRATLHSPDPAPVRKGVRTLASRRSHGEQHNDTCNPEQPHETLPSLGPRPLPNPDLL